MAFGGCLKFSFKKKKKFIFRSVLGQQREHPLLQIPGWSHLEAHSGPWARRGFVSAQAGPQHRASTREAPGADRAADGAARGRGARTCRPGAGPAGKDPGAGRRARPGRPPPRPPAWALHKGARHGTDGATQRRLSHAGGARPRPAPAAPDPSSHPTERQTRRVPDLSCPACSESVMFGQERGGAGGQVCEAGGGGARGGPLRRLRVPAPGRRREVTKW